MATKLRKYQRVGVRRIERRFSGRCLIADEMGLGKTLQSLKVMQRNKRFMLPTVVICPAPLKWNWADEASKHLGMNATILEGTKPPKRKQFRNPQLLIINYEILGPWMNFLLDLDPQLYIIDEAHYLKSRSAKRTENVQQLTQYSPHLLALTGTPLTNQPAELFTVLNMLWPDQFKSFFAFAQRYTKAEMKPWGWQYKGARNLDELHHKLLDLGMLRRRKVDVLHELPDKTITVMQHKLTRPQMREYNKAKNDFLQWLAKKSKRKAAKARKAARLVKIGYLRRLAAELKLDGVRKWLDGFLEECDAKLLVFGIHHDVLRPLHARYKSNSVIIDGTVTGKKRHTTVEEFKKQESKRIAFCNYKAGGIGLNMQEASHVLCVELPWTPAELDQAISRAHRMGQQNGVNVTLFVSQDTIEERLCKILQEKQGYADALLDGGSDDETRLDIFDQLTDIALKGTL